jgi:hypothetical protein
MFRQLLSQFIENFRNFLDLLKFKNRIRHYQLDRYKRKHNSRQDRERLQLDLTDNESSQSISDREKNKN